MAASIREQIPDGTAGLQLKLARARQLVDRARGEPRFRELALRLVAGVPERSYGGEIGAVSAFVRRVRYTKDPVGVEWFTRPAVLAGAVLQRSPMAAGDCDDFSILGASLLESLGHETRFVVGGHALGAGQDPAWAHIWLQVRTPKGWQTVDDTAKIKPLGFDPSSRFDVTMSSPASSRRPPRLCYGGATAGLQGFSLKKLGRAVARPFEQVAKKIVPAPVRSAFDKTVGAAWQATGRLYEGAAKAIYKPLLPFAGTAINTIAPGAGTAAQPIIDRLLGRRPQEQQQPTYAQEQPAYSPAADGGGMFPGVVSTARKLRPNYDSATPAWVLPAAIAGGAVVLLLVLKKKGRR